MINADNGRLSGACSGMANTFKGNNSNMKKKVTSLTGASLKGKNLLPMGANSFL